ncbi:Branched-chain amino acid transport system permease protein LivM (TC 3.A.1.4.1) [hydrothermal vent metagenome]|uniref:Branched-chain amino acid transport system permease protein LivM (TC 3.A.1.4.1) n=1 Tax=hydrothermal vent metagenome TaxID=652676 RepID=A0A3B0TVF3_9ZZZZ
MRFVFKRSYDDDIKLFKHRPQMLYYLALLVFVVALPWLIDDFFLGEATNVLIWAIAGMGLMLLTGHTGQVSLGHAAFMALGAYANVIMLNNGVPFIVAFPLAGIITGLVGALVALPILRLQGIYLAIATLAISIMTGDIIVIGEPITGGVSGLITPQFDIFGLDISRYGTPVLFYFLTLTVTLLVLAAYRNLLRAPLGRAFVALRDSEISAQAMGVNITRTKAISFGLSCVITGLAGALLGLFAGAFNNETFDLVLSIQLLLMIVIGGLGSIHGAFFGAVIIGFLPQFIAIARDGISGTFGWNALAIPGIESGLFALILIGFVLFEPMGLYGSWVKMRTYFELFPFYRKGMFKRQKTYLKTERMR